MFSNKNVERLLQRHGVNLAIERPVRGEYNPATGNVETSTIKQTFVKGFISTARLDEIQFTSIPVGDRRAILMPYDIRGKKYEVSTNDVLVDPVTEKRLSVNRVQEYRTGSKLLAVVLLLGE